MLRIQYIGFKGTHETRDCAGLARRFDRWGLDIKLTWRTLCERPWAFESVILRILSAMGESTIKADPYGITTKNNRPQQKEKRGEPLFSSGNDIRCDARSECRT
jgi:hypothetical protein